MKMYLYLKPILHRKSVSKVLLAAISLYLTGCSKKDDEISEYGIADFGIVYYVEGEKMEFDTIRFINAAGNIYSVTSLKYYISDVTFFRNEKPVFTDPAIHYIDAQEAGTNLFVIRQIPIGQYTGIRFYIGLNDDMNQSGALPKNLHNENMAWPDPMGGGYHFLKLEGYFVEGSSRNGYAMHLGTNSCRVIADIGQIFSIGPGQQHIQLRMNINEWFSNPVKYDLTKGNYTMGIMDKMLEIAKNGSDVFTIK